MQNHERLLSLYNELDSALRSYYQEQNMSSSVMMRFIKELTYSSNSYYVEIGRKLNMVRVLRNDLVHELDMNNAHLIEVTDETISFLEEVIKSVKHPAKAIDACTKFKDLSWISIDDENIKVLDLVREMRKKGFTALPILNHNHSLFGVFSPNVLFEYLSHSSCPIEEVTLKDIRSYLPTEAHFSESYLFVGRYQKLSDLSEEILTAYEKNQKPQAVFVTATGNRNEPVLGLLVMADIIRNSK